MEYTEINEQYIELLYDYFDKFKKSSIHKNIIESTKYFYIGLHSYNRIFNYVLFKTNSLDKAIFYSKKSVIFYLEYIEQMSSQLSSDFNVQDTMQFIYKNTIYKLYDGDEDENIMSNLVTNNKTIDNIDIYQDKIEQIYNVIHLFCYWNNNLYTYHQRIEICKKHLKKILKYIDNLKPIIVIIEKIQQFHSSISYDNYQLLLKELIDKYDKISNKANQINELVLQKFHVEEDIFKHKLKNMRELVKWIYN